MNEDQNRELIQRYFFGTISESEMGKLDERLKKDATLRTEFFAAARLDTNLRDAASSVPRLEAELERPRRSSRYQTTVGLASAAVMLLSMVLFFIFGPDKSDQANSESHIPIASISKVSGSMVWIGDGGEADENLQEGRSLTGGTLEIRSLNSWAEIVFLDGSSVWASGPAALTISDGEAGKMIRVREGNLSLNVTPQPSSRPLRLITPSAEAVVLGTQFNLSAGSSSTSFTVNEGSVQVTRLADGSVQEVAANHRVIAALEQESEFKALPRGDSTYLWKSSFPLDVRQGHWMAGDRDNTGLLKAAAHLFQGDRGIQIAPILLHTTVVGPTDGPVILSDKARFRIRGRLDHSFKVSVGFGTHFSRGGFAGKYSLERTIEIDAGEDGRFDLELALEKFPRKNKRFPASPSGHELVWFWVQTVKEDLGLEIFSVELLVAE